MNAHDGSVLPFNPNLSNKTYAVAMSPGTGRLYVGGNFTTVGRSAPQLPAEVDPDTGGCWARRSPS